jgi:hypothetical protein
MIVRPSVTQIIAKAITSLGSVIFVMLMVVAAMVFFSHTLFTQALPATMSPWEKTSAAWLMAFGWELTVLVTTCNVKHLHSRIPIIMAVCSGIILLYFVQAFDSSESALVISQRWFIGILIASINFIYAELFYKKWQEFKDSIELPGRLIHLESSVNELQSALNQAQSKLTELHSLKQFKVQVTKELTCPHCGNQQSSYGSLHAHKGHCRKNPRNQEKEII